MALKGLQRISYRLLNRFVTRRFKPEAYTEALQKARVPVRPEAFLANALLTGFLTLVGGLFLVVVLEAHIFPRLAPTYPIVAKIAILAWFLPPLFGIGLYYIGISDLSSRAKKRAKDINLRLPYALNYIAAMSSAGVIPTEIFRSLGRQKIYGDVASEAAWIYKDIALHGIDIVTALRRAMDRTPSRKWQEVLQGAVTTITSGGDLKAYFLEKANRYQIDNRQDQKAFIDTMGLMAETYVTIAVAGPLFMIVMLAIIAIITGAGPRNLAVLVYLVMPVINFGYVFLLKSMIPEV